MLFDTTSEYDAEITRVQSAISRQLMIGSEHRNDSAGSSHETKEIPMSQLRSYLLMLKRERSVLAGDSSGGIVFGEGW
jgi:hypothetical protein